MSEMRDSIPNHTVDPATGFLESNGYATAFDAQRKQRFLKVYKENGLGFYRACKALGLSHDTVNKACRVDPVFKAAFDEAMLEYADELEAVSRQNALNPRSVIERIFQLKSLIPSKYADQRVQSAPQITINIDGKMLDAIRQRSEAIDVQQIEPDALPSEIVPERPL